MNELLESVSLTAWLMPYAKTAVKSFSSLAVGFMAFVVSNRMKGEATMKKPEWFDYAGAHPFCIPLWTAVFAWMVQSFSVGWLWLIPICFLLLWLSSYINSAHRLFAYSAAEEPSPVVSVSGRLAAKKGWLLALGAVLTFAYVLYWLTQHGFTEDTFHYVNALVIAGWLAFLPFRFFSRSVRAWAKGLLLLFISAPGAAGLWLLSHPDQLFDSFPLLAPLMVIYPDLSSYLIVAALACAFLPAGLLLAMLLPRKVAV